MLRVVGVFAATVAFVACSVPDAPIAGKACPCPSGYRCDVATNTCTSSGSSAGDAGVDGIDAFAGCTPTAVKSVLAIGTSAVKFSNGNTVGDVIVVGIRESATSNDTITAVTDTAGNTYARAAGLAEADDNNLAYYVVWYAPVTVDSSFDNTVATATGASSVFAVEYSCVALAGAYDSIAGAAHIDAPFTIDCAMPDELVVSVNGFQGGGVNWTVGGTDRSGVANKTFEYNDFIGVAGANSVIVSDGSSGTKPSGIAVSFQAARP